MPLDQTNAETLERLLPTIRNDLMHEADRIRDADFARYGRIHEVAERCQAHARRGQRAR